MPIGTQAKILNQKQEKAFLLHLQSTRLPLRNQTIFLLSTKAGLRAKEIATITWSMVSNPEGEISNTISLPDKAAKGKSGREIPMHPLLHDLLIQLKELRGENAKPHWPVIYSERGHTMSPASITEWFRRMYDDLGFQGASSHSGRRTFITRAARKVVGVGGSLRDVQQLAGHSSLANTQRYIEGNSDAKRKLVALI